MPTKTQLHYLQKKSKNTFAKSTLWLTGIAASVLFIVVNNTFKATNTLEVTAPEIVFTSPVGKNRSITLSDGTSVTLAGNSSISVNINQHERHILLHKGSAYFDVIHDSERVFFQYQPNKLRCALEAPHLKLNIAPTTN